MSKHILARRDILQTTCFNAKEAMASAAKGQTTRPDIAIRPGMKENMSTRLNTSEHVHYA